MKDGQLPPIESVKLSDISNRPRGEQHPRAKLTEEDVRAIRTDRRGYRAIAAQYGVSIGTVSNIKNGKVWNHLDE